MKILKHITLLVFFCNYNSFSQEYLIEYNHKIKFETNLTEAVYMLQTNKEESSYFMIKNDFKVLNDNELINANEGVTPFIYKDFVDKKIIYNQPIINKIYFLGEDLPLQSWKLENDTKDIKSFKCKKATSIYRGRTYTAWYTDDLSIIGGPWKFDGLPGLILSISSDDGVLSIEALKIERKNNIILTKFNYDVDKLISWNEYCSKYREVITRIKKNMKADADTDVEYDLKIDLVEDVGLKNEE